ncbi:MAG TPA: LysE family transporter [Opitutaceae bacterium]|nr:LysE family transporter [Opitutaceae bacterium]
MITIFVSAFLLGLVLNAAPGPVLAATLRHCARGGFRGALAVQLGSLVGDCVWALLGLAGLGLLLQLDWLRAPLGIAGGVYLCWLAWQSWREAKLESVRDDAPSDDAARGAAREGMLLALMNPQNIAYWAAIGSALGSLGVSQPTLAHYAVYFGGFMAASVVCGVVVAWLVERLLRRAGLRWARLTYRACALGFLLLALSSFRSVFTARATGGASSAASAIPTGR